MTDVTRKPFGTVDWVVMAELYFPHRSHSPRSSRGPRIADCGLREKRQPCDASRDTLMVMREGRSGVT
jgi:hypothetical protein